MNTEVYDHIETVLLTEKATLLSEKLNKYVFRVRPSANKLQIKRAIEIIFKKKVADVNTANFAGKKKARASCRLRSSSELEESNRNPERGRKTRSCLRNSDHGH